jgi:hypothetical protein
LNVPDDENVVVKVTSDVSGNIMERGRSMLKTDVFFGLVVVSAIALVGGESRSDDFSDDRDHNGAGGGAGSSVFGAHAGQSELVSNTGAQTILGNTALAPTALAYDPNSDVVYVCDGNSLYTVNKTTEATTFVGTYFQNEQCNPTFGLSPAIR